MKKTVVAAVLVALCCGGGYGYGGNCYDGGRYGGCYEDGYCDGDGRDCYGWGSSRAEAAELTAAAQVAENVASDTAAGTLLGADSKAESSLDLDTENYTRQTLELNGEKIRFRAYENRAYVARPVEPEYQTINIYVPEAYFHHGQVNGYTATTAPIFLPNTVGGYMPGKAGTPSDHMGGETILTALQHGCVVAAPGARGRTNQAADGTYTGKAPALIVDLKAAVRYLRHNAGKFPGDTEKIISNGTSAGGALSALVGATGDSEDYAPYLQRLGAAEERDDIFAASCYCPITNLEHADMAYEWVFADVHTYHQGKMGGQLPLMMQGGQNAASNGQLPQGMPGGQPPQGAPSGEAGVVTNRPDGAPVEEKGGTELTKEQILAAEELRAAFPAYLNSLNLTAQDGTPLTLDPKHGDGTFKDYIESLYLASAQQALDSGTKISGVKWLKIRKNKAKKMDFEKYAEQITRLKGVPAFDAFDLSSGENSEFGTATVNARHFTEFSLARNTAAEKRIADARSIRLLNPLNYISAEGVKTAPHWRIRHGSADRDTALPIPAILALTLENKGYDVDFAVPWGQGHAGDYDLAELFAWVDSICK